MTEEKIIRLKKDSEMTTEELLKKPFLRSKHVERILDVSNATACSIIRNLKKVYNVDPDKLPVISSIPTECFIDYYGIGKRIYTGKGK